MISYRKLLAICEERKITSYTIKKNNIVSQASWMSIKNGGNIDTKTINALCRFLECQPGDIMEYVSDE